MKRRYLFSPRFSSALFRILSQGALGFVLSLNCQGADAPTPESAPPKDTVVPVQEAPSAAAVPQRKAPLSQKGNSRQTPRQSGRQNVDEPPQDEGAALPIGRKSRYGHEDLEVDPD